jgi:coenzyme F420 hydrogenase subunit beta
MTAMPKLSYEESLEKIVVSREKCMGCGACIIVCPFACLRYANEKPTLVKKCGVCGICAQVCPRFGWQQSDMERFVFGRERRPEEIFGIYRRVTVVRASDEELRRKCQDGGAVTALLKFALEKGIVEAAVVSGLSRGKPLLPNPVLASEVTEVIACAGTRYTYSPNIFALKEGILQKRKRLGYVGTPCQIQAIRKMEMASLKQYVEPIKFTIGLMCTESFTYSGLIGHFERTLGIHSSDISKVNIKGQLLISTKSSGVRTVPLKEIKQYTRQGCLPCDDFSGEFADISVGGLGMTDWTFVIVRTGRGEEIFSEAEEAGVIRTKPVEEEKLAADLLVRLSERKRNRAKA